MSSSGGGLTSRLAKFNPFAKIKDDEEDHGEVLQEDSVAGGGNAYRKEQIPKHQLNVSRAIKEFLNREGVVVRKGDGVEPAYSDEGLPILLKRSPVHVPSELKDRSHPLTEYFISSSHNTYLVSQQLYGTSSAAGYKTALTTGSRCVEIDAWDNEEDKNEPKVTHGYTLVSNISFRLVCETMRDVIDQEAQRAQTEQGYAAAPIMLSLENHCSPQGQLRLVQIMREVWGNRLLDKPVREVPVDERSEHIELEQLGAKICVIVEYHTGEPDPEEAEEEAEAQAEAEEDPEIQKARDEYKQKSKETQAQGIIPELAELGVYAQSVKPTDSSWFENELKNGPHHHLVNISETQLATLMPKNNQKISQHNSHHLMRVFPKGTRISSHNLNPVPFWAVGAHICALNWQTFDASMQLNEALFTGTDGYVLKPAHLRTGADGKLSDPTRRVKLSLRIAGASDLPLPEGRSGDDIKPYVTCSLVHPADLAQQEGQPVKRKTSAYKQHKLGLVHKGKTSGPTDPVWDEELDWEFEESELAFLRLLVKSDDAFAKNPVFAVAAVRLSYVVRDWCFVRLLDLKGRETKSTLLVRFEMRPV